MPFVSIPNTAMIEVLMRLDSQSIENTYYAESEVPLTLPLLQDLAEGVLTWVGSIYFNLLSNMLSCVGVKTTDLTSNTSGTFTAFPVTTMQGAVAQPSEPSNVSFVIKHLTAQRGRSARGRCFVPGIPHTSMAGTNTVSTTLANGLVTCFNDLDAAINGASMQAVVASRFHNNAPRAPGIAIPILTHAYTDLTVDSQRPRLPGRGR